MPDFVYKNLIVSRLVNRIMKSGKKAIAEQIVYRVLEDIGQKTKNEPVLVLEEAFRNVSPVLEVRPRRVGGATYQVPREVSPDRALTLAMRWVIQASRSKKGKSMWEKLSVEIMEAYKKQGAAFKKKEDTHKMAEANRAFAHFGW